MHNKTNEIDDARVKAVLEGREIVLVEGGHHGLTLTLDDGHVVEIYAAESHPLLFLQFEYRDEEGNR